MVSKLPISNITDLPNILQDALPDAWGFSVLKHTNKKMIESVGDILSFLGHSGAWSFKPNFTKDMHFNVELAANLQWIKEQVTKVEKSIKADLSWMVGSADIGGARPKFYTDLDENNQIKLSENIPPNKRRFILKLPSKSDSENAHIHEYAINLSAQDCGLNIPQPRLIKEGAFASKRFDINPDGSHNLCVTYASITDGSGKNHSYEELIDKAYDLASLTGRNFALEIGQLALFNYLIENCDDHARNISFIHQKNGQWDLAPFYDLTQSFLQSGHEMRVNGTPFPDRQDFNELFDVYEMDTKEIDGFISKAMRSLKHHFDSFGLERELLDVEYRYQILNESSDPHTPSR